MEFEDMWQRMKALLQSDVSGGDIDIVHDTPSYYAESLLERMAQIEGEHREDERDE